MGDKNRRATALAKEVISYICLSAGHYPDEDGTDDEQEFERLQTILHTLLADAHNQNAITWLSLAAQEIREARAFFKEQKFQIGCSILESAETHIGYALLKRPTKATFIAGSDGVTKVDEP